MSIVLHRCSCPHCQQNLEYDEAYAGRVIDCPCCSQPISLPMVPFAPPPPKPNLVGTLIERFREHRETAKDKATLQKMLLDAVADGELTDQELQDIQSFMRENQLHASEIQEWSRDIFKKAVDSIKAEDLSLERIAAVENVKERLSLSAHNVTNELERLSRFRLIAQIRAGQVRPISVANIVLRQGEAAYWVEPARLWESKVVSRRYEGGSAGVSFRIAKGITLRTGGTRGRMISDTADVPVADGNFIITNRRLIFQGDVKSFETKFEKIISIENYRDGIRFSESNRQKPRQLSYDSTNGDIIVEVLSRMFTAPVGI